MAAKKTNPLIYVALAAGGYYLYTKNKGEGVGVSDVLEPAAPLTPLAPMTGTGGGGGAPLTPNWVSPAPGAVSTPYGPVIPSNFDNALTPVQRCRKLNPSWSDSQCETRLKEILFRYLYIVNSIRNAQEFIASGHAANQLAQIQSNIATLMQKKADREAEYKAFTGEPLPAGTINTPEKVAEYKAFLSANGWCDPFVGLLCPGYNYGVTANGYVAFQTAAQAAAAAAAANPPPPVTPSYTAKQLDIIYRYQYINDSIRHKQAYIAMGVGVNVAEQNAQLATLATKRAEREADWRANGGTGSIPAATSVNQAGYIAFLRAQGWCDPYVGIPCAGWNP